MANNIFINGRSAVHQGSNGSSMSISVNWTKVGKYTVPIPYPVASKSSDADNTAGTVIINGNEACHADSVFSKTSGDAPGKKKGIMSNTVGGEASFLSSSMNVFFEGTAAVRSMDLMTLNGGNTPPTPLMQPMGMPAIATAPQMPPEPEPPEQGHAINIRAFGQYNEPLVLQSTSDDSLQYRGTTIDTDAETEQGMNSHSRITKDLQEGEYQSWISILDTESSSQYSAEQIEAIPVLETKSGWVMTPIPGVLTSTSMEEEIEPSVELVPVVPARGTFTNSLATLDNGWLYIFVNGHLWRELSITADTDHSAFYKEVNLITQQGRNTRKATGKATGSIVWLPRQINGENTELQIAHSNEQWNWSYIRRLGGMDPENDPRYNEQLHSPFEMVEPDAATPAYMVPDPSTRLTTITLADYNAATGAALPEVLEESDYQTPTPDDFPMFVPLAESGLPSAIMTDAEQLADNGDLPVLVLPNPLQLALELAAQHKINWGLFNTGVNLFTNPAAVEAMVEQGHTLSEENKSKMVNDAYRFQSARMLHKLFIQQPEALQQTTGNAENDAQNKATADKFIKWREAFDDNYEQQLEDSLKKIEFTDLKHAVVRSRQQLIDFMNNHQSVIDVFFLDMAARQDLRGYFARTETAHQLFGHLQDSVKSWEQTVFDEQHPLDGEHDTNQEGAQLFAQLMHNTTLYSESLMLQNQMGSDNKRTHTGRENAIPDGIGGFDGNRIRYWNTEPFSDINADATVLVKAFTKVANTLYGESLKQTPNVAAGQAMAADKKKLTDVKELAEQMRFSFRRLGETLSATQFEQSTLERQRQKTLAEIHTVQNQIERNVSEGVSLNLAVYLSRNASLKASQKVTLLAQEIKSNRGVADELKNTVQSLSDRTAKLQTEFDEAMAELNQDQQALLDKHEQLNTQKRQQQQALKRAQLELDDAEIELAEEKRALKSLQEQKIPDHQKVFQQIKISQRQLGINDYEQTDYRRVKQAVTQAKLSIKQTDTDLKLNIEQLKAQSLVNADGSIATKTNPQHALEQLNTRASKPANTFKYSVARSSAVLGTPVMSVEVFDFEATGSNTRPGTHQPMVDARVAALTERGVLQKLSVMPNLKAKVSDVAGLLYLYDTENRQLSHLKDSLKNKFDAILGVDKITADSLKQASDMKAFNQVMAAHHTQVQQYTGFLENYVEQLDTRLKAQTVDARLSKAVNMESLHKNIASSVQSSLNNLDTKQANELNAWATSRLNEHMLQHQQQVLADVNLEYRAKLDAELMQLNQAREAINLSKDQIALKQQVLPDVQAHLDYLTPKNTSGIARWSNVARGNATALSFLSVLTVFELRNLTDITKKIAEGSFTGKTGLEFVGSVLDSLALFAQITEKMRIGLAGEIKPLLQPYAGKLVRAWARGHLSAEMLKNLPNYLQLTLKGVNAPAFNRMLIRTVLISSTANALGALGAAIGALLHLHSAYQAFKAGDIRLATGYSLMALGSGLQATSSFAATSIGARRTVMAGRGLLFLTSPGALLAGIAIEVIGLIIVFNNHDGMKELLRSTTWGTKAYQGNDDWQQDAAAEWMVLYNTFLHRPQASWSQGALRCDQPRKSFELMLPGFKADSAATLNLHHHIAQWHSPMSVIYDEQKNMHQQLTIEHSPGITMDARLSQQLNRFYQGANSRVQSKQTAEGLRLKFTFDHFDFIESHKAYTLHTLALGLTYYPEGRNHTLGLNHNTQFAIPMQPPVDTQQPGDTANTLNFTLTTAVVSGGAANAEQFVTKWHREGQKYLASQQEKHDTEQLSPWELATGDPLTASTSRILGDKPAWISHPQ